MPFLSQAHLTTYLFFYIETVDNWIASLKNFLTSSYLFSVRWSGVDDGVDGSDVEDSDVDDEGVDGDEFFRY